MELGYVLFAINIINLIEWCIDTECTWDLIFHI